jgi:hypothetical protein
LDQFCLSVSWAVVSSPRQASLLRPRTTAPRPAASQLGPTCSVGGLPPRVRAVCLCKGALEDCRVAPAGCDVALGGCSSLRTSGGLVVGCRCPIGARESCQSHNVTPVEGWITKARLCGSGYLPSSSRNRSRSAMCNRCSSSNRKSSASACDVSWPSRKSPAANVLGLRYVACSSPCTLRHAPGAAQACRGPWAESFQTWVAAQSGSAA